MDKRVTLLGCAVEYLPVLFDICNDTYGTTEFHIYKNIVVDAKPEMPVHHQPYLIKMYEPEAEFLKIGDHVFYGVTGPYGKQKVFNHFNTKWNLQEQGVDSLIHPKTILSPTTSLGSGTLIEPGVVVSSQTEIGFGVTIKRSSSIGHHCNIEEFVEINPGVTISGQVTVGAGSIIGSGAVVRNGITIGANSVVGMGSVVTKDIPEGVVAFGNPCEVVRENKVRT